MDDTLTRFNPKTNAEYRAAMKEMLAEIERKRELMRLDDIEIAASQARADLIMKDIRTILDNRRRL